MSAVSFKNVIKKFPASSCNAVNNVTLEIEKGEFITVVGTSGCGKTTLLKMINRLVECDSGELYINDENIKNKDPVYLRRGIGYVIQQSGLFPHMTVFENIEIIPKLLKWDKKRIAKRVEELLTLVNLDYAEFYKRRPAELSGGQQQRVGLARALAVDPDVMLLDEPFGAIDAINRTNLQNELLRIHRGMENSAQRRTYIFVTHDINEALKLGTRILVMNKGDVIQFDTPDNILKNPVDGFVRELIFSQDAQGVYPHDGASI
jgi:osmoprotectant transport system ATP-binding protein